MKESYAYNIAPSVVSSSETPFNCLVAGPLCEGAAAGPHGRTQTGRQFRKCSEWYKLAKAGFSNNGFPKTLTDSGLLESHCGSEGLKAIRVSTNSARVMTPVVAGGMPVAGFCFY
jgi:hypothetical protein